MASAPHIARFLAEVRRRLVRRERARTLLEMATGLSAMLAVLPLIAASELGARPARAAVVVSLAALVLVALIRGLIAPYRRFAGDRAVARFVGQAAPALASDLLSTVELTADREPAGQRGAISSRMIAALGDSTAARAARLEPAVLVDRRPLRRPARLAALGAAAAIAITVFLPERVARGWQNLLRPAPSGPFADAARSETPLVGDLTLTLTPPAYTGRPPTTLPGATGDFRAMPGTGVQIETVALARAEQAFLVMGDERAAEADAMVPLAIEGDTLRGHFVVTAETRYRFLLVDGSGRRSIETRPRTIDLEADAPPTVELHAPADQLDVSGLKRIELAYLADDDHGLAAIDLVWQGDAGEKRMSLLRPDPPPRSAQDKLLWDLAEVGLRPGGQVTYWIEVTDNDTVRGPNRGESKRFSLRVLSPRERHEGLLASERDAFEKLVGMLGGRLTAAGSDVAAHDGLLQTSLALVVELGTLVAALERDPLADRKLVGFLGEVRERLDRASDKEAKLLRRAAGRAPRAAGATLPAGLAAQLATGDRGQADKLEDDVLTLADWIGRQDLENLLAISDEIAGHRQRLDKLMQEYARAPSDEIKREIERELRALEQLMAEQEAKRGGIAEDVLDQFVHTEALDRKATESCLAEVRRLLAAGDAAGARKKMTECGQELDRSSAALEQALGELRGDRFGPEEKRLGELQHEMADLAEGQREIAGKLDELNRRYGELAASKMREEAARAAERLGETASRLQHRLERVPEGGLGAFEKEELGAVKTRLGDLGRMLADGDLAEAREMARQAEAGLETIAGELAAALDESQDSRWRGQTEQAQAEIDRALPLAARLVDELNKATPSPAEILGPDELAQLDRLRAAQQAAGERAGRLGDKARGMAGELPGQAGQAIADRLDKAKEAMGRAEGRMKARDPSGARPEARAAADALEAASQEAQGAARLRQDQGEGRGMRDEPIRIPGADEYKPPAQFREEIMDAMKRQGEAPTGYGEMLRRYYEELSR